MKSIKNVLRPLVKLYRTIDKMVFSKLSELSPELATKLLYLRAFRRPLNLNNPLTFNEKIQWLKLNKYGNNKLITKCSDKYLVRDYVKECGCEEILNEQFYVWTNPCDINWDILPEQFVIKCNHGAGYNIICANKDNLNIELSKKKIEKWMKEDFWKIYSEINYRNIKKKIICEKYLITEDSVQPADYKVYCFNGEPRFLMLCTGRESGQPKFYYFDREWNFLDYYKDRLNLDEYVRYYKPKGLDDLFSYASILSKPFAFVRVDLYLVNGKVIFGELTFAPSAGLDTELSVPIITYFGSLLDI